MSRPQNRWSWLTQVGLNLDEPGLVKLDTAVQKLTEAHGDQSKVKTILAAVAAELHSDGVEEDTLVALLRGMKQYHAVQRLRVADIVKSVAAKKPVTLHNWMSVSVPASLKPEAQEGNAVAGESVQVQPTVSDSPAAS